MDNFAMGEENKTGLGNKYFDCKYERKGNKYSGPCPVPYDIMAKDSWSDPAGLNGLETWTIEYTLRDKDGYEKALGKDLGISTVSVYVQRPCETCTNFVPTLSAGLDRLQGHRYLA
jgi:hypothetical protein